MDKDEIKRLASLSRLSVPEAELATIGTDIATILGFVDTIQAVQLDDTRTEIIGDTNVFREDIAQPLLASHDLITAAPSHQDNFVKVPKVIE